MKVLIPLTNFGPQGGFRVLSELANHWIAMGHCVEFLAHKSSIAPYFPTVAKVSWFDNNGKRVLTNDLQYAKPLFRVLTILNALIRAINSAEYDVILANQSLTALPVFLSKKCSKKFYYIQAYEPEYYLGYSPKIIFLRFLSRLSYNLGLKHIVNSPLYFNYKEIKSERFVYPGIDFSIFKPQIKESKKQFVVGCVGRIEPFKGTLYVLEAFKKLRRNNSDLMLHVAFGAKELESESDGIKVIQVSNDRELSSFYSSVDVIVAPGTVQLGAVHYPVIEAMACKTPVITTGYYPAADDNAWIVPIKDSDSIAVKIGQIMEDRSLAENKAEKAYLQVQELDWNIVSEKMLAYFENA